MSQKPCCNLQSIQPLTTVNESALEDFIDIWIAAIIHFSITPLRCNNCLLNPIHIILRVCIESIDACTDPSQDNARLWQSRKNQLIILAEYFKRYPRLAWILWESKIMPLRYQMRNEHQELIDQLVSSLEDTLTEIQSVCQPIETKNHILISY